MTFDEYWNDPDRARAAVGLYTHQIARAAYEAGARETEAQLGLYGERDRSRARIGALEEALVLAAIPLEAIKASVKWELSTDINAAVGTALIAIRRVLAPPTPVPPEPEPKAPKPIPHNEWSEGEDWHDKIVKQWANGRAKWNSEMIDAASDLAWEALDAAFDAGFRAYARKLPAPSAPLTQSADGRVWIGPPPTMPPAQPGADPGRAEGEHAR